MKNKTFGIFCLGMLAAGIIYSFYMYEVVILWPRTSHTPSTLVQSSEAIKTPIFYFKDNKWLQTSHDILWDNAKPRFIQLIQNTLDTLHQEHLIAKPVKVEFAQTNNSGGILYVQFDRSPLHAIDAVEKKIAVIDSIMRTIAETKSGINAVQFLVNHKPMVDMHLDFIQPWIISILSIRSCY